MAAWAARASWHNSHRCERRVHPGRPAPTEPSWSMQPRPVPQPRRGNRFCLTACWARCACARRRMCSSARQERPPRVPFCLRAASAGTIAVQTEDNRRYFVSSPNTGGIVVKIFGSRRLRPQLLPLKYFAFFQAVRAPRARRRLSRLDAAKTVIRGARCNGTCWCRCGPVFRAVFSRGQARDEASVRAAAVARRRCLACQLPRGGGSQSNHGCAGGQ